MIRMFMDGIADPMQSESPYIIKREFARILELSAVPAGQKVRVCVTGPLELYISAFGTTAYSDILYALAESVARFLERARQEEKMSVASLDEPSLGISSAIIFSEDEIKRALDIASAPCRGMDCEVHLHSPLFAETCAAVPGISIVGIESAAHTYFNKTPGELKVEEAAMLIGMLKNSSLYNPVRRPEITRERRNVVLSQMQKAGHLTKEEADSLKNYRLNLISTVPTTWILQLHTIARTWPR